MTPNQRNFLALLPGLIGIVLLVFTPWYLAGIILVFVSVPLMFLLLPPLWALLGQKLRQRRLLPPLWGENRIKQETVME